MMGRKLLAVTVVGLLIGAGNAGQDADKHDKDSEGVVGLWRIVSHEKGGEKVAAERFKDTKIFFHADGKLTVMEEGKQLELTFKLHAAKKPKQIDVTAKKDGQDEVHKGIYVLHKNELKICISRAPDERPTEFVSQAGTTTDLFHLKREKD
jgi:uncharacterized protein (TIGR03067 family)